MRANLSILFLILFAQQAASTPISMYIGTFAIDDYVGNGGGKNNLGMMIAGAQNFYLTAYDAITQYTGGSLTPYQSMDKRNTQVTASAFKSTASSYGARGYNDFVGYFGHGLNTGFYLGASSPPYGLVTASQLSLGSGYERFFLANACSIFNNPSGPISHWNSSFKGLKAMIGYKSLMYDNNLSWYLFNSFWNGWTFQNKSLLNAFFDANSDYGYKHLFPSKGLTPGCLSAQVPIGTDYATLFL